MPLNSVQLKVQEILQGLALPGWSQTLQCFITPPVVQDLSGPVAYVWGGKMTGARLAMPRGAGFKKLTWTVQVYLAYETTPDDPEAPPSGAPSVDQAFPLAVDAVMTALWTTPMPVALIDPTTNVTTQMVSIGEQFDLEYPPVHTPATLRMLYFAARLNLQVQELPHA